MSYQRHLACAGVVAPAQTCEDAHCDRWAKRKEVVAISVALGNHNLQTPDKYRHPYSDIDYDDGGWLPPVVETSFGLGITGAKPEFRPEREVTRAEAYGMMMKSVCMPLENDTTDWMYNIFLTAQKYKITSRSNQDFHGENSVSRQELFVVGSRLLDYVNETGGCYAKVVCEE